MEGTLGSLNAVTSNRVPSFRVLAAWVVAYVFYGRRRLTANARFGDLAIALTLRQRVSEDWALGSAPSAERRRGSAANVSHHRGVPHARVSTEGSAPELHQVTHIRSCHG